jgi:hypothetical protein
VRASAARGVPALAGLLLVAGLGGCIVDREIYGGAKNETDRTIVINATVEGVTEPISWPVDPGLTAALFFVDEADECRAVTLSSRYLGGEPIGEWDGQLCGFQALSISPSGITLSDS